MSQLPKVLILGAGYGGIVTAQRLEKTLNYNEAEVTLVNKHNYHYFTTHLHMPAAGTDTAENTKVDISQIIDFSKTNFVKGTVQKIDKEARKVVLEDGRTLDYDYLVIAVGGEPETFGIPGMKEYALSIRSINSVNRIREHIERQFEEYRKNPEREDYLTFIVGGAGFTGIEFVGELANRLPELAKKHGIDPSLVKIYNIEAAPSALPGFDPELVEYAMNLLSGKGVEFKVGIAIKECKPDGVVLANDSEIKAQTIVWTGGVRGNRIIEEAGFEAMRGRVKVDKHLRAPGFENVFVIGDNSIIINEKTERPYPPTAQIAMQQGVVCADNIAASIRGQALEEFKPHIKGTVASLGKGQGIGIVGKVKLKGFSAAVMKKIIDARALFLIGGLPLVFKKMRL